jgi:hypothetical protein
MFDWRQLKREGDWRGVDCGWRWPKARVRLRALLGALACLALLALPLAAEETAKAAPEAALKGRGQAFWEARIKGDYATQYGFLEPKMRRQLSLTDYIQAQGPLKYLEGSIEEVKIDEAKGILTVRTLVRIKYPPIDQRQQQLVVHEEWVKRQGEWYRVYPQS